jgi:hypothetical protein
MCLLLLPDVIAGELLTCPVTLHNVGSVALHSVSLTNPASACTASLLEPYGTPHSCNITVVAAQEDFEFGALYVYFEGVAFPRMAAATPSITWNGSAVVPLTAIARMHVEATADPMVVTQAGDGRELLHFLPALIKGAWCAHAEPATHMHANCWHMLLPIQCWWPHI